MAQGELREVKTSISDDKPLASASMIVANRFDSSLSGVSDKKCTRYLFKRD